MQANYTLTSGTHVVVPIGSEIRYFRVDLQLNCMESLNSRFSFPFLFLEFFSLSLPYVCVLVVSVVYSFTVLES